MGLFLLKRLLTLMATLLGASAVVFLVLEILPGNAAQMLMGPDASPEAVAALATKLGLDQPALQRYGDWIGGLLVGNMGESYAYSTPVLDLVLERLALTIPLALLAMVITAVLALLAGVYAASRHNRWGDVGVMALAQIGIAMGSGTDVAIETSDVVLMNSDFSRLPHALGLTKATAVNMRQNIMIAVGVVLALLASVFFSEWMSMSAGMLVHEASILAVILNGMRLLRYSVR